MFDLNLPAIPQEGQAAFVGQLGRVSVLLGANGSGKSRLVRRVAQMAELPGGATHAIFVEGGRAIAPPSTLNPHEIAGGMR